MRVIVIAGTSSGVGKTSISVGLMRALRQLPSHRTLLTARMETSSKELFVSKVQGSIQMQSNKSRRETLRKRRTRDQ